MEMNRTNGKTIPLIKLSFQRGMASPTVREAMAFIRSVSPEEGAVVSTVIERRPECGGRLTTIVVRSAVPFDAEEAALTWWVRIMSRLEEELPGQRVLLERLSRMSFMFTTPAILDLLQKRNGRGKPPPGFRQEWKQGVSDILSSKAKAIGGPLTTPEDPSETR